MKGNMKTSELKLHKRNPRQISNPAMDKLKDSIERDPEFMKLRPIVVDENNTVLGGNQRLRAIRELGYKDIPDEWVKPATGMDAKKLRRFMLIDNLPLGEWDIDILSADFELPELEELGFTLDELKIDDMDIIFDDEATNSNSGGHDILTSVSFWIYDHKITDSRDHVWDFVKKNKERIRDANQEKVVDAILRALNEVLD